MEAERLTQPRILCAQANVPHLLQSDLELSGIVAGSVQLSKSSLPDPVSQTGFGNTQNFAHCCRGLPLLHQPDGLLFEFLRVLGTHLL